MTIANPSLSQEKVWCSDTGRLLVAIHLRSPSSRVYASTPMSQAVTEPNVPLATNRSPVVGLWQRFFYSTSDNERILA